MGGPIIVHPLYRHTLVHAPEVRTLEEVPQDVLLLIAARVVTAQELCVLQRVSKRCRQAACSDALWKRLCMSRFAVPGSCSPPSWQQLYKFNHTFLYQVLLSQSAERFSSYPRFGGGSRFIGMGIAIA
ncbi:hypothetical protein TSOC_010829 [Tetrabaena socialis]|uniref:F-box domain-containing protein n=1 Tax=Tetrabaena socialis TaxID=47790 RepID=A0A2J7ZS75_9CHLO|nr:hypothetical protein TSOC_010829 [Tetrabaena socialis]|eukprot:PNH03122.1 hypothetical protein TSOC_010829 [Tetrabaena socialis]